MTTTTTNGTNGIAQGGFDPRREVPALLETIGYLAAEFRDVFEGSAQARGMRTEAVALCVATERLGLVIHALTATALICAA